jgi:hypothetical protein
VSGQPIAASPISGTTKDDRRGIAGMVLLANVRAPTANYCPPLGEQKCDFGFQ